MGKNKRKGMMFLIPAEVYCTFVSPAPVASQAERMVMTVAEIVRLLIEAHKDGKDVNLNK